jgi:hypothetical protein
LGVTWPNLNGSGSRALEPGSPLVAPRVSKVTLVKFTIIKFLLLLRK